MQKVLVRSLNIFGTWSADKFKNSKFPKFRSSEDLEKTFFNTLLFHLLEYISNLYFTLNFGTQDLLAPLDIPIVYACSVNNILVIKIKGYF